MEQAQLYSKISVLPTDLQSGVNDFVDFLLNKKKRYKGKETGFGCAKERSIFHKILMSLSMISKNHALIVST